MSYSIDNPSIPYIPSGLIPVGGPCTDKAKRFLENLFSSRLPKQCIDDLECRNALQGLVKIITFKSEPFGERGAETHLSYTVYCRDNDWRTKREVKDSAQLLKETLFQFFDQQLHGRDFLFVCKGQFPDCVDHQRDTVVQYVLPDRHGRARIYYETENNGHSYKIGLHVFESSVLAKKIDGFFLDCFMATRWLVKQAGNSARPVTVQSAYPYTAANTPLRVELLGCIEKCREDLTLKFALAFAMGLHARLGRDSPVLELGADLVRIILQRLLGRRDV